MTTNTNVAALVKDIHDAIAEIAGVARYPDLTEAIDTLAALASAPAQPVAMTDEHDRIVDELLKERDAANDYIDALLDEVLGADRNEWTSNYGHADAMQEVRDRMAAISDPEAQNVPETKGDWWSWHGRLHAPSEAHAAPKVPEAKAQAVPEDVREIIKSAAFDVLGERVTPETMFGFGAGAFWAIKALEPEAPQPPAPSEQRKPLTDVRIGSCIDSTDANSEYGRHHFGWFIQFARAIEAAHGIRSTGGEHE